MVLLLSLLPAGSQPTASATTTDPVLGVAGDIACDVGTTPDSSDCQQAATAKAAAGLGADAVLPLGDEQYQNGTSSAFSQMYDPTWGSVKSISHPVPGNHEYQTAGATGYYGYFGSAAGDPTKGYYSWNIGAWHLIALNSNCDGGPQIGCSAGSPQETWLRSDLAANPGKCILAYWHEPRFSSGNGGSNTLYQQFWQDLYNARADVILNGHTHSYEEFSPQSPTGAADPLGPREFVVGTGGINLLGFTAALPNETVRQNSAFGVLKLTLHSTSYDWNFVPIAGRTWTHSGTADCHAASLPAAPTGLTLSGAPTSSQVGLSWTASTSSGVAGYRVYRNGSTTPLNASLVTGTSYTDTTVSAGTRYTYAVSAVNTAGQESPVSNSVTATVPTAAVATVSDAFDGTSIDTTKWTVKDTSTTHTDVTESGGNLVITGQSYYPSVTSVGSYNLTGSSMYIDVPSTPAPATYPSAELQLNANLATGDKLIWLVTVGSGPYCTARTVIGGVTTDQAAGRVPAGTRFFRISESGGTITWDYSADGTTWTSFFSSNTLKVNVTSLQVAILGGHWGTDPAPTWNVAGFNTP